MSSLLHDLQNGTTWHPEFRNIKVYHSYTAFIATACLELIKEEIELNIIFEFFFEKMISASPIGNIQYQEFAWERQTVQTHKTENLLAHMINVKNIFPYETKVEFKKDLEELLKLTNKAIKSLK